MYYRRRNPLHPARQWAIDKGFSVSREGGIPHEILEQFEEEIGGFNWD